MRALELERYDGYLRSLQPLVDGSDSAAKLRAIGLALGVAARRAKLLGIDAVQTGPSADEIMRTAGMLVTIIQSHVHDQRILDAIADQFEAALARLDPAGLAVIETTPSSSSAVGTRFNSGWLAHAIAKSPRASYCLFLSPFLWWCLFTCF